ncbi:MAG: DegV family EDD domain-containing protein, partial [Lachnospiraceae bacterium]|nr:DegV family EDD domain-containing protein [Lachnospiraceae bacterium]
GVGIKKEDIPYLFTAYKRVNEEENRHIEGTGLGLSIVKQLLDLMGGKISVNSVYTQGTTFLIEIPQRIVDKSPIGQMNVGEGKAPHAKKAYQKKYEAPEAKVLVVDDNETNLMVAKKLLRDTGAFVDTAKIGREARAKNQEAEYQVIFMDHLMPEMDGIECARKIRQQTGGFSREAKFVALTANTGEENRKLYEREGFDGYLAKPVSGESMERELYRLLPGGLVTVLEEAGDILADTVQWASNAKKKRPVVITTESVADLPEELVEKYGIGILPYKVCTKEGVFQDGLEIETGGLITYMEKPESQFYSMAPDVAEYEEFFVRELSGANHVVHITISGKIEPGGYHSAMEAAASFGNVFVVDSEHLSGGQGLLALEACHMAEAGSSPVEIVEKLETVKKQIRTAFTAENLDYFAKAGMVSGTLAQILKSVMLRTVLVMKKGDLRAGSIIFGSKERAWEKYISSELSRMRDADPKLLLFIHAGLSKRELDAIKDRVEQKLKFEHIYVLQASPAIAANCGPGTFGFLYRMKT